MTPTEINDLHHEDSRRVRAWNEATAEARKAFYAEALEAELAKLVKKTPSKVTAAQNLARYETIKWNYGLVEFEGLRNPIQDDMVWGPNRIEAVEAKKADTELDALAEWLEKQTWSEFAVSLASQYRSKGSLSEKQIAAAKSMKAKIDAREAAKQTEPKTTEIRVTGLDLTDLPSGYYAVPNGDTRLKVRVARPTAASKWHGWIFVSDGAAYGQRRNYGKQAPSGKYQGEIGEALQAILADPLAAQVAYGKLTGTCGACGKMLEDPESIERGMGPWCAAKWAA